MLIKIWCLWIYLLCRNLFISKMTSMCVGNSILGLFAVRTRSSCQARLQRLLVPRGGLQIRPTDAHTRRRHVRRLVFADCATLTAHSCVWVEHQNVWEFVVVESTRRQNRLLNALFSALSGWCGHYHRNVGCSAHRPRDFLALNKAALRAGLTSAPQLNAFRATHDVRSAVRYSDNSTRRLPPNMVFGAATK